MLIELKNTQWWIKNVLTWSFGSSSHNAPQAKDNGSLVLLHDLFTERNHRVLSFHRCNWILRHAFMYTSFEEEWSDS